MTVSRSELRIEVSPSLQKRFDRMVDRSGDCHIWTGGSRGIGYGAIAVIVDGRKKVIDSHRVAWVLANGPLPAGTLVRHKCGNRACVNPDHLILGNDSENRLDAFESGSAVRRTDKFYRIDDAKLTLVLAEYTAGTSKRQIARKYDIPPTCLTRLLQRHGRTA